MTLRERFWNNVDLPFNATDEDCWLWKAAKDSCGYGRMSVNNTNSTMHRLSFELHKGSIPSGMLVCHTCDTPSCVNPSHLFLGTEKDNMRDMKSKGRDTGSQVTHCANGHEYTPENTLIYTRKSGRSAGRSYRRCKICEHSK